MHKICIDGKSGQIVVNGSVLSYSEAAPNGILHFGEIAERFPSRESESAPGHISSGHISSGHISPRYVFKVSEPKPKRPRKARLPRAPRVPRQARVKAKASAKAKAKAKAEAKAEARLERDVVLDLKARLRDIVHLSGAVALASEDMTSWWLCLNRDAQGAENANVLYEFFGVNLFPLTGRTTERGKDAMESFASVETRTAVDAFFRSAKNAPACVVVVVDAQLYVLSHRYTAEPGTFKGECRLGVHLI
jgi:hypothetical protein